MKYLIALGEGEIRDSFFTDRVLKELEKSGDVIYNMTGRQAFTKEELMERIGDVDVLFSGWGTPRVDADVLAVARKLRIHAHTGGSVASYVSREEYERGIIVLSGNDLYARSVAEGCLCYTLMAQRRIYDYLDEMKHGGWRPKQDYNLGMIGKKIGIIGYGAISNYYMELLQWFGAELYISSRYITEEQAGQAGAKKVPLDVIFEQCDIISLHAALNKETEGMITRDHFKKIKDGALWVNTARAGITDEKALIEELKTGRFRAVVDVYMEEPLPADSEYRSLKNVTLMPHIAGPTFDMREEVVLRLLKNIKAIENEQEYSDEIPYEYAVRMTVN